MTTSKFKLIEKNVKSYKKKNTYKIVKPIMFDIFVIIVIGTKKKKNLYTIYRKWKMKTALLKTGNN